MIVEASELGSKEAQDLVRDILDFKKERCQELTLLDTILEYSYKKDKNVQEIGDILSEHLQFVSILESQLNREKFIYNKERLTEIDEDEW